MAENLFGSLTNAYVPDWLKVNKMQKISREALAGNNTFELSKWADHRAMTDVWTDPLFLNFRLMINYGKPYGLFATPGGDEETDNSAISYLRRIGENSRADMLIKWIDVFQNFIREHDYMIMSCEGLSEIFNHKQGEIYTEADKVNFGIREAVDMRFQSLLTMYRHIWFDDDRGVEILPINLRRFDIIVVVYSAGYFNTKMYDVSEEQKTIDDLGAEATLPTIKKIIDAWQHGTNISKYNFNSTLFYIGDCSIDLENSGKNFFENIVNDASAEQVKNNLSLNFRFAYITGNYSNTFGKLDIARVLAIAAASEKANNLKGIMKDYAASLLKETKAIGQNYLEELKAKPSKWFNALLGEQSYIGNALSQVTDPAYLASMVKNTIDVGITTIENKFIYSNIDSLQKIVRDNFSPRFIDLYNDYLVPKPKFNEIKHNPDIPNGFGELAGSTELNLQKSSYKPQPIPHTETFKYKPDIDNGLGTIDASGIDINQDMIIEPTEHTGVKYQVEILPITEDLKVHRSSVINRKGF